MDAETSKHLHSLNPENDSFVLLLNKFPGPSENRFVRPFLWTPLRKTAPQVQDLVTMATDIGEWSDTKDATEEIQRICDQVKDQVEKQTGMNYRVYKAVKYRVLFLCGGTHYLIKVHVGGKDYAHLMVVQGAGMQFPPPPSLVGVQLHKTEPDPLVPFTN